MSAIATVKAHIERHGTTAPTPRVRQAARQLATRAAAAGVRLSPYLQAILRVKLCKASGRYERVAPQ